MAALAIYDWPGNVRELINVVDNAFAIAKNSQKLFPEHLPTSLRAKIIRSTIKGIDVGEDSDSDFYSTEIKLTSYKKYREHVFNHAEKPYLKKLLTTTGWNIDEACTISELSRSRLYALLKKHDISRSRS